MLEWPFGHSFNAYKDIELKYIFKRLVQLIPILFAITFLSFAMMRLAGSDVIEQKMLKPLLIIQIL